MTAKPKLSKKPTQKEMEMEMEPKEGKMNVMCKIKDYMKRKGMLK